MLEKGCFLSVLVSSPSPALEAAPRELRPGTVQCALIRHRPKIRVDRYDYEVIDCKTGFSDILLTMGIAEAPDKYGKSLQRFNTDPLTIMSGRI